MKTFIKTIAALTICSLAGATMVVAQDETIASETMSSAERAPGVAVEAANDEPMASISRGPLPRASSEPEDLVWSNYLRLPDADVMESRAITTPVVQDNARIVIIPPPKGFDSAAYVVHNADIGVYLIANISNEKDAINRAREIERQARAELNLEKVKAEAPNVISATSLVPIIQEQDLKLVNVIVSKDMLAGNTVTLAFTY